MSKRGTQALAVTGAVMMLNGAVIGTPMIIAEMTSGRLVPFEETVANWRYVFFNYVYLAVLVALVVLVPAMAAWRGRSGKALPIWVTPTVVAVAVLQACTIFAQAVISPFLLKTAPAALVAENGGMFATAMTVIWIAWVIALWLLAVNGIRSGTLSKTAAAAMMVGGLIIPVFGPIGSVFVGAAFLMGAWQQLGAVQKTRENALA